VRLKSIVPAAEMKNPAGFMAGGVLLLNLLRDALMD
jgi:hypothetical protein